MLTHPAITPAGLPRSGAVDFLRVVGIVAVVVGHVAPWSSAAIRESVYTWHVPLFFFLSGYLWNHARSVGQEIEKRARSLLVPYAVWLVLIGLWGLSQLNVVHGADIRKLLLGGWHLRGPMAAFWFVTALFIAVVLLRVLQTLPSWLQWALAMLALIGTSFRPAAVAQLPFSAGVACACLVFVLAGRELKRYRSVIPSPLTVGLVLLAACAAAVFSGWSAFLDLKNARLGTPVVSVLVAIGICTAFVLIAEHLIPLFGNRFNAGVTVMARCGFMVVLTHAVVLVELTKLNVHPLATFIVALGGPWLVALWVLRTPLAPILLGSPRLLSAAAQPAPPVPGATRLPAMTRDRV